MKALLKINNSELSYRLNLNYNNVYSRLKMLLGRKASLFADVSTKSSGTTWYSDDDAEYTRLGEAPKEDVNALSIALNDVVSGVRKELSASPELAGYVDDILEIPDNSFVFYRKTDDGYKFILAGWGCKFAHQSATDPNAGFFKRMSKTLEVPNSPAVDAQGEKEKVSDILAGLHDDEQKKTDAIPPVTVDKKAPSEKTQQTGEKLVEQTKEVGPNEVKKEPEKDEVIYEKKTQNVILRVLDQNNHPVAGEIVTISTKESESTKVTSDEGTVILGKLPYGDSFGVTFPNIQGNHERVYEVEPNVEGYDAFVKKLVKYSPVLFVEDQNGNPVQDYNVKIVINGQDSIYNTGWDGVIQLPTMQEGQKFIAIDTANYANTEEFNITQAEAKTPYHFHIKRAEKAKVGITVLDKSGNPIPKVTVDLAIGDTPCQQVTAEDGRVEFPYDVFVKGEIPVNLTIKGKGQIKSKLNFTSDTTEYTIQLQDKKSRGNGFNWKWLALIPLLLLLGFGGYKLYNWWNNKKVPSIAEMGTGVVMTLSQTSYWVDVKVPNTTIGGVELDKFYFVYSSNEKKVLYYTFDSRNRLWGPSTGTGFLISKDGMIATNRHVADPLPPEEMSKVVKNFFQDLKTACQDTIDLCNNTLHVWEANGNIDPIKYNAVGQKLVEKQTELKVLDKIINTADFKVYSKTKIFVAFTNARIDDCNELWEAAMSGTDLGAYGFHKCTTIVSGTPGNITENDLSIIQINSKERDVPQDAFVFSIPEIDILDGDIPDAYEVTVLGYNAGTSLQDMNLQDGIKPQAQHGKITNTSEKYRVGYDAQTLGGSSGAPVLNKDGQLVAINNSGIANTQGFNYGVRTKYLKELLDKVQGKKDKN